MISTVSNRYVSITGKHDGTHRLCPAAPRQLLAVSLWVRVAATVALSPSLALATPAFQSHDSIRLAAQQYLETVVAQHHSVRHIIDITPPDTRLRLPACEQPLSAYHPVNGPWFGRVTVAVRCHSGKPWVLHVPATVTVYAPVLVAARPLRRNAAIASGDFELAERDLTQLVGSYYQNSEQLLGLIPKRDIPRGRVLSTALLAPPVLVARGDQVIIEADTPVLQIRMQGKALANGKLGERIQVKNLRSNRVIEGIVTERGAVRIPM